MSSALLPPNAKFDTRAIADVSDSFGRLRGEIPIIREIGRTVFPTDWLPWLIENVGMGAVLPHVPASAWLTVYQQRHWVYYRGTAAAHELALGWIGFDAAYRDGSVGSRAYDHFDILLDRYPSHAELPAIVGLSAAGKATASIHHRIVYRHDVPAARAAHDRYGSATRGSYSGVVWRADWPKLSLRATLGGRISSAVDAHARGAAQPLVSARASADRHWRFAHSRRGFDAPVPWRRSGVSILLSLAADAQDAGWSRLPWSDEAHGARPLAAGEAGPYTPPAVPAGGGIHLRYAHSRRAVDAM